MSINFILYVYRLTIYNTTCRKVKRLGALDVKFIAEIILTQEDTNMEDFTKYFENFYTKTRQAQLYDFFLHHYVIQRNTPCESA